MLISILLKDYVIFGFNVSFLYLFVSLTLSVITYCILSQICRTKKLSDDGMNTIYLQDLSLGFFVCVLFLLKRSEMAGKYAKLATVTTLVTVQPNPTQTCICNLIRLNIIFCVCMLGTPSPAGHLCSSGIRGEEGQHGDSCPRGWEQHRLLWVPLSGGL